MPAPFHAHLDTDARLKGRDAQLFLSWIQGALADLIAQGVEVSLSAQGKGARLEVHAPDEALLAQAMAQVASAMRQN